MEKPRLIKKNSPEASRQEEAVATIEQEFTNTELLEIKKLAIKAKARLDANRIYEENFKEIDRRTNQNIQYVKDREEKIRNANAGPEIWASGSKSYAPEIELTEQFAILMEAVIYEVIQTHGWLGEHIKARPASRFDDIANSTDIIAFELKNDRAINPTALATDETISPNSAKEKIGNITREIQQGALKKIHYFEYTDARGNNKKELDIEAPRVVIALTKRGVYTLAKECFSDNEDPTKIIESMINHAGQIVIREQIITQLQEFAQFARTNNKPKIAKLYEERLQTIVIPEDLQERMKEESFKKQYTAFRNNPAHQELIRTAKRINE